MLYSYIIVEWIYTGGPPIYILDIIFCIYAFPADVARVTVTEYLRISLESETGQHQTMAWSWSPR
jgi:hypothetical protein